MAVTNPIVTTPTPTSTSTANIAVGAIVPAPKSPPLWRFALVGLGPLTALGVFALLVALFQRMP